MSWGCPWTETSQTSQVIAAQPPLRSSARLKSFPSPRQSKGLQDRAQDLDHLWTTEQGLQEDEVAGLHVPQKQVIPQIEGGARRVQVSVLALLICLDLRQGLGNMLRIKGAAQDGVALLGQGLAMGLYSFGCQTYGPPGAR